MSRPQSVFYRKALLTSLFLGLLGLWLSGNFMAGTGLATSSNGPLYIWGDIAGTTPGLFSLPNGVFATTISAGGYHDLTIGTDGKLYAWGQNQNGQLGNNSTTDSISNPVLVQLPAGVTATTISAGLATSLAVGSNGKLYGWGDNGYGQVGDGSTIQRNAPVLVNIPAGVTATAISVGRFHSLAIGNNGKVYAWGGNQFGQLGDGTGIDNPNPVIASLPAGVTPTAIAAGQFHSLALGNNGKVYAWGANIYGQLGTGNNNSALTPVIVSLPAGVTATAVSASSNHSMALGNDGKVYAWGSNTGGELGNGTTTDSNTPVIVQLPAGVNGTTISAGGDHDTALGSDGKLYAWGNNYYGQLGDGTNNDSAVPVVVQIPAGVIPLAFGAGFSHSMTILPPPSISISNTSQLEGNSGTTPFVFTSTLAYASNSTITVTAATNPGTATAPGDYTATSGTVSFAPGVTTASFTVPVIGDTVVEPDETFTVSLSNAINATIASSTATGTIINDDFPSLSLSNVSQNEGNSGITSFVFTATLSTSSTQTTTVNYATSDGTATAGSDYTATSGTLTFPPGTTSQTITVVVNGDTTIEPDETFTVNLSNPTNVTLATSQATGTIVNDDFPSVSIGNVSLNEGNSGTTPFVFTTTLSAASPQTITVNYATLNGTATAPGDFIAASGTLTFTPGTTSQTITVLVKGDTAIEPDESFTVNLSNPTKVTIATGQGTGTVINDDFPTVSISNVSQNEGNSGTTSFVFTATLSSGSGQTITVNYATSDGTATAGSDYTATSGTLTFAPGTTSQTITVLVNGDTVIEPDETFFVNLSNPTKATIATGQGAGTIVNDDAPPTLSINDVSLNEGNSGTTAFAFTATLSYVPAMTVTVDYATANGTATAGSDYTATSGTLTFAPGTATQTVTVLVLGDTAAEPNETFFVNLTNAVNSTIADGQGQGTIINDDSPSLSINNVAQNEGNSGITNFVFTATLSLTSVQTVTVSYATSDGTAMAGSDYIPTSGTLTFAPGTTAQTITVPVSGDISIESNETFTVTLSSPNGATLGIAQGIGTIINDDAPITTTTTLANSPNPSSVGQSVTFTATVSPAASGTVTFTEGSTLLGTASVVSGTATYATSSLSAGSHVISATYSGNNPYTGSSSAPVTQVVNLNPALAIVSGDNQQTVISTAFGRPLVARVTDASSNPASGVKVVFTAPVSGASAAFGGSAVYTGTTDAAGLVTSTLPTANSRAGSYTVSAQIEPGTFPAQVLRGETTPRVTIVQYHLTNLAGPAATISVVSGSGQSAVVNTTFGSPLVVRVVDSGNNPVSGAAVTFSAPGSGASGSFAGGSLVYTGTTSGDGVVTSTVFTSNSVAGNYTVTATVGSVANPATFALTNLASCSPLVVISTADDGSCGTLRYAVLNLPAPLTSKDKTIRLNLPAGSVITLTTGLTLTSGAAITTTAPCGVGAGNTMLPPVIIQGVGTSSGDGLTLSGNNSLYGLWVRGFSGVQIKAPAFSHTKMQCVKATRN